MPKVTFSKRCKSDALKGVKVSVRAQKKLRASELEGTDEFAKQVVVTKNPAILKAKQKKIAYTIARENIIVEVRDGIQTTIGTVKNLDVHIAKGTTYTIAKN